MLQFVVWTILALLFLGLSWTCGHRAKYALDEFRNQRIFSSTKEAQTPKIDIKLFPFPEKAENKYKYPLKRYVLMIQNLNKQSVPIYDFRVEFIFENVVNDVKQNPLIDTGGSLSVGPIEVYEKKKDGSTFHYEEQPLQTSITESFSLDVVKAKVNDKKVNTNIAVFSCSSWPENVSFGGEIIVDLSNKPEILKKPDMVGKYEGIYFYKINNKQFLEKFNSTIPASGIGKESFERDIKKEYWENALSKIDSNEGTIFYRTSDDKWLEYNNYFVEFIPHIRKDNFELHVYRDKDNMFKVLLSNGFSKGVVLQFKDLARLRSSPAHPNHAVAITWGQGEDKLYLDGVLVDSFTTRK